MADKLCPRCSQKLPTETPVSVPDDAILKALKYSSPNTHGKNGPAKPWLYAAADPWNSREADLDHWYVTGPRDRRGYIAGPFSYDQIQRVAATGKLSVVCRDNSGTAIAYELAHPSNREGD